MFRLRFIYLSKIKYLNRFKVLKKVLKGLNLNNCRSWKKMCVVLAYAKWWYTTNKSFFNTAEEVILNDNFDCFNPFSSLLSCSVSHGFLQSTASYSVHVWGTGHPQHRRAASPPHRLPPSQIHQRDQRHVCLCARLCSCTRVRPLLIGWFVCRSEGGGDTLRNHAEEVPGLQCDPPPRQPPNVSQTVRGSEACYDDTSYWLQRAKSRCLDMIFGLILKVHSAICFQIKTWYI